MPRVTHVKRAQQRYATKPVIDPATGEQKVVPVMNKRTGEQKVTKRGRPVFLSITERDLERPLPMPKCDAPACTHESREIKVGESYKWIEPSGQRVRNRHADCPNWNVWEYSSSLSARIAQIQSDDPEGFGSVEDAAQWAADKAGEIRELAEEKRESASNIEDGFGHATYQSDELNETADNLEQWADDLENVDLPEYPEAEEQDCEDCGGTGEVLKEVPSATAGDPDHVNDFCPACDGKGQVTPDDPTDDQIAEWESEVIDAIRGVLDEAPC
jgi:hypothetical protein